MTAAAATIEDDSPNITREASPFASAVKWISPTSARPAAQSS